MALIETRDCRIDELILDPENPRLPARLDADGEKEILRFLALSSSIDELISAIGSNGYFSSEPLIGVVDQSGSTPVLIVEGNRRLTALKLLNGETFPDVPRKITDAVERAAFRPDTVPVAIYSNRTDILNYLGNKHIAGVKPWGALAKAKYSKQLFDATEGETHSERVRTVARTIGSRVDFISRSLKALDAYQVAEQNEFFDLPGVDESAVKFSLLGTALDYEGIQKFLFVNLVESDNQSVADDGRERPTEINAEHLKELFSWLFQKLDGGRTRVGESRNIADLSKVVVNQEALKKFRLGMSLDQAFKMTDGIDEEFDVITTRLQSELRQANSLAADITRSESRFETVKSISKQARHLKSAFEDDDD